MQEFAVQLIWKEIDENGKLIKTFRCMDNGAFKMSQNQECTLNENSFINVLYFPELSKRNKNIGKKTSKMKK